MEDAPAIRVENSSDSLIHLRWRDGHLTRFHPMWLRQNCHCVKCRQHRSGQRIVKFKDIPEKLTLVDSGYSDEKGLILKFNEEMNHDVLFPLDWLSDHDCSQEAFEKKRLRRLPKAATSMQFLEWNEMQSEKGVWQLVKGLMDDGVFVVKNVPTDDGFVVNAAEKIGPVLVCLYDKVMNIFSEDDPSNGNIAHTTSWLPFHEDIPYIEAVPGLQLLHCIRFDDCVDGGENMFIDAIAMCERLRLTHPEHFRTLTRVPATFQMMHNPDKVQRAFCLRYQTPHILINNLDEVIGFRFSPNQEGPLQVPEEDQAAFFDAYRVLIQAIDDSPKIKYRQRKGDAVFFNNRRMLHSREGYTMNGGQRHLQAVYVSMTDFVNKYCLLASKYGDDVFGRRVGDSNYM